ncbi:phosphoenolpyruvate carboxykinase (ATP) [Flexibacter flexilis DSM 6793]|uniref:Phosphoenolpyruvate carboxykinase (ATP) n=1 Tax=Flexibacter flexilis DSM 6793 TaxID=927664 RepID=A0A1I1G853_9BACT|nr:phosphoenolpyruvate carboxykinase (ATP) [Flexibacter flexilis]SFC07725.1 phosphoenolpyruvate carboxykinase (ATP) [Flexibacter flexilis DSM 6793]
MSSVHSNILKGAANFAPSQVLWNLTPAELVEEALRNGEGVLADNGALMADTGKFTGRSPKDKFVVKDANTEKTVWWGDVNNVFDTNKFEQLYKDMVAFLEGKRVYVRELIAGANPSHNLRVRVVNTVAWHNLFCYNMFIRPAAEQLAAFDPEFTILCVPEFQADPAVHGTRQSNFAILDFTRKMILIGGTGYAGEMKKGIFAVLNYMLPHEQNVLSMHCSANIGKDGDSAVFFGLSGTGKTTLSADPLRNLVGDDEHGWAADGIFNFEGGCYAKVIDLSREKEPQIFDAIRFGSILENTRFYPNTRTPDYANKSVTENTRTSYPLHYIPGAVEPSVGPVPKNIFFLTADAFGVLPPISRLTPGQAMYHFISGYTAKVAGTEVGVVEPQTTFSACFGQAFLPLHPTRYAAMLGQKISENKVNVWLVNTGWSGGSYGVGSRIKLPYTRALITAALSGELDKVSFTKHPVFGVEMPDSCPNVPTELLHPRNTWSDKAAYDEKAQQLAKAFADNFEKFSDFATEEMLAGAPKVGVLD